MYIIRSGEVLVVWNKGLPPIPVKDFPDAAVPIRIRVEEQNSMNNRYKPDPEIRHRAVLSLDDDLLLPCADLERAFALWRLDPARLVGYFPRLVEPAQPPPEVESAVSAEEVALAAAGGLVQGGEVRYHGEPEAIRRGRYNMILSGAAFIDSQSYFPAYWSEELSPARDLVNELRNCDDMLMNFVVGNVTRDWGLPNPDPVQQKKEPMFVPVDYVRAQRRLDVSHFSGVGTLCCCVVSNQLWGRKIFMLQKSVNLHQMHILNPKISFLFIIYWLMQELVTMQITS